MPPTEPAAIPGGVRLTARLPKATHNGLTEQVGDLLDAPRDLRTAVIAYDVARVIEDVDDGTRTAVVRITRIEPLAGAAERSGQKLLAGAAGARMGEVLPLEDFAEWAGHDDDADGTDDL